jgi:hypothetical protein
VPPFVACCDSPSRRAVPLASEGIGFLGAGRRFSACGIAGTMRWRGRRCCCGPAPARAVDAMSAGVCTVTGGGLGRGMGKVSGSKIIAFAARVANYPGALDGRGGVRGRQWCSSFAVRGRRGRSSLLAGPQLKIVGKAEENQRQDFPVPPAPTLMRHSYSS